MDLTTEDRLAIGELYARYNHMHDSCDGEGYASCFTTDGIFYSHSQLGTQTGRAQLADLVNNRKYASYRHWISNLMIEQDGDGAKGTCYGMVLDLNGPKPVIMMTAIWHDQLVKEDGVWLFKIRKYDADTIG